MSGTGSSDAGGLDESGRLGESGQRPDAHLASLLEDSTEDLYENAPCGYLSTFPDGQIARVNATLLGWLGFTRGELVGRRYFSDLLTAGGRLYHETHFAPLLAMQGEIGGVALELQAADGSRLPVLVNSAVKTSVSGAPLLIRTTIVDARDRRAYERELLRARREADLERERLQLLLTTLQRTLLPPELPDVPGLQTAAYYHAASRDEVGGDFYDLFALARDRWGLFLGDVCGKGAAAAAVTSQIRYTLRAAAVYDPDPATVLGTLNSALRRDYERNGGRFCTAAFGVLTPRTDGFDLSLASGGHPAPLLLRADGTADYQDVAGGPFLGVIDDVVFTSTTIRLGAGDTFLLYTDGLTEARTGKGRDRYGDLALRAFAASLAPATAAGAIDAITVLLEGLGGGLDDDVAVLALSVPRTGNAGCLSNQAIDRPPDPGGPMTSVYDSERLAAAYAVDRPPVHEQILRSARLARQADRALDVGCGAGLSTAALAPLARRVVGLEPIAAMLAHRRIVAPHASFVIGRAERLPFAAGSFDLVTAAGSLNYADFQSALAEIARVLTADGAFLLYDFSSGRSSVSDDKLERWFASFEQRFPWPPGWQPLDVRELPLAGYGLQLLAYTDVETRLPMDLGVYLRYALSETNVENSIATGACSHEEARDWCRTTLEPVFADGPVTVVIPGHVATLARAAESVPLDGSTP